MPIVKYKTVDERLKAKDLYSKRQAKKRTIQTAVNKWVNLATRQEGRSRHLQYQAFLELQKAYVKSAHQLERNLTKVGIVINILD